MGAAERLRELGLDVDFLLWLEGEHERVPRVENLCHISAATFANAVRGAVWLTSQFAHADLIEPETPEDWLERYKNLEAFLWNALRQSMTCRKLQRHEDLQALEAVIKILRPPALNLVRKDIQNLRKRRQPPRLEEFADKMKRQRTGGRRQAEWVQRMRAAIQHIESKSKTPYSDLAELWNEHTGKDLYSQDSMYQRLRKGKKDNSDLCAYWKGIYDGNRWLAFPGDYPQ